MAFTRGHALMAAQAAVYSLDSAKLQVTALPGLHSGECIGLTTDFVLHA